MSSPDPEEFSEVIGQLRERDHRELSRANRYEANRRGNLFLTGGSIFWTGLAIIATGPEQSNSSLALVVMFPAWPAAWGAAMALLGVLVVSFRGTMGRTLELSLLSVAACYLLLSGTIIATWVAWRLDVGPGVDEPALLLASIFFTLSLFAIKGRRVLREARRDLLAR